MYRPWKAQSNRCSCDQDEDVTKLIVKCFWPNKAWFRLNSKGTKSFNANTIKWCSCQFVSTSITKWLIDLFGAIKCISHYWTKYNRLPSGGLLVIVVSWHAVENYQDVASVDVFQDMTVLLMFHFILFYLYLLYALIHMKCLACST